MESTSEQLNALRKQLETIADAVLPKEQKQESDGILEKFAELKDELLQKLQQFKPGTAQGNVEADETPADKAFQKRMWRAMALALVFSAMFSVLSFKYLLPAFPIMMGIFTDFTGINIWLFCDEFMFYGNSMKRISNNAIATAICVLALALLFGTGVTFGNSYVSDPAGSTERGGNIAPTIKYEQPTTNNPADSVARSVVVEFPERSGKSTGK